MARAETIENVGETGGSGGNGPLPSHNTCRMELPRPFYNWPGLLTTTSISTGSGTGTASRHLYHNHHHLHPLQALYLSYPLAYPRPEGWGETQTHRQLPALSPSPAPPRLPLCNRREGRSGGAVAPSAFSGEQSESYREERQEASSRQGPLPDLLPQNEHPSWASPHHRAPRGEAVQDLEVRRVANQLRTIGDEFNATVLLRAHAAPHWQDWRDACRGLLNFITQTLSTLYRLT
ncbi:bcl-2-binding component 3 [Sander lucioperca]|uniref:bcl-2-binding component 3 n=1 Tax=Sander lucioperca TaxID=283035 RepID=UPI00125D8E59|nr:bcl-2-binding component 3 [Sander lucioperca]